MSPQGRDHSFDELTRGLASGTLSRGKALRLMGAALVGGALASIPGIALAKPNKPEGAKCNHNHQCASGNCSSSGACAAACTPNGGTCSTSTDCCSGICDSSGFCFPPTGPDNAVCQCADDSGNGQNIRLGCMSECNEFFTFSTPVCTSVCTTNGFEFVSGACDSASPVCA
jgi:hypothetical protein